jgi:hypothetical protein
MADIDVTDNVIPLQTGTSPEAKPVRKRDTRAAARQAKKRSKNKADRDASRRKIALAAVADAPPIAPIVAMPVTASSGATVTPDVTVARLGAHVADVTPSRRTNYALAAIAYGFFALGIGINVWNASSGGAIADMALPAALGVLAEAVVFFLPAWALTLPIGRQVLAWALFAFISVFALTNSLRMASITAADQMTTRADRQTEGVQTADHALDQARTKRDEACGPGHGKSVACKIRQAEVTKLEATQTQAAAKVVAQAKPESTDFAKLVAWVSRGAVQPGADDFSMLWLLFRTFLPQVGGLVLMLAQRRA